MKIDYAQRFYDFVKLQRPEYEVLSTYTKMHNKILIKHKTCGHEWMVRPLDFKGKYSSCPVCYGNLATNSKAKLKFESYVINEAKDYTLLSEYITAKKRVKIRHNTCGHIWDITPTNFKDHNIRCPQCANNYSQASIKWLTELSDVLNIDIQHMESGGEFIIPGTRYRVDGYCKEYNLIFEFHGDLFHGSLVGSKILPNPFTTETGEECFSRTLDRMNKLDSLGYSIFYVFEHDWNTDHVGDFFNKHPWALT